MTDELENGNDPFVAQWQSSTGNYARSIAAWDSKVSFDLPSSIGADASTQNGLSISGSATTNTPGTDELDKLCLLAAELFVGGVVGKTAGKGNKTAGKGIWESLPVNDVRGQPPVMASSSMNLAPNSSDTAVPINTSAKPLQPVSVPSSRKLESSIHATGPIIRAIKDIGKRDDVSSTGIRDGMGNGMKAVLMRKKEAKMPGGKEKTAKREMPVREGRSWKKTDVSVLFKDRMTWLIYICLQHVAPTN